MPPSPAKTDKDVDVLIVGSGPIGAVFAHELINATWENKEDIKVLMVDIGPQESLRIGDHKKNSVAVQKDISLFTNVVNGKLHPLSIPTGQKTNGKVTDSSPYTKNGQNPRQSADENLTKAAASRVVGGMGALWTCCTPEQHKDERDTPGFDAVYEHYERAKVLFNTTTTAFNHSVRQQLVMNALTNVIPGSTVKPMPLACHRITHPRNTSYVEWTCPATILDKESPQKLSDAKYSKAPPLSPKTPITLAHKFEMWPNTQCVQLKVSEGKVVAAILKHLLTNEVYEVTAQRYVLCAGAVLTPGILHNSGFVTKATEAKFASLHVPHLGKNLSEQTMAFGQVKLWKALVESVRTDGPSSSHTTVQDDQGVTKPVNLPAWGAFWGTPTPSYWADNASWGPLKAKLHDNVEEHLAEYPHDPLPFPVDDPDPQCYYPYTVVNPQAPLGTAENRPWHTQIHRDAFGYGQVPDKIDQRRVVDLRWFGYNDDSPDNWVEFSTDIRDEFDMPQPTFHFKEERTPQDTERRKAMLADMTKVGKALGSWIEGAEPHALPPGSALHICGTYKAGIQKDNDREKGNSKSVVNQFGQMWHHDNVVLGGCGIIPKRNACNPTLTAACFAIHAVKHMVENLDV